MISIYSIPPLVGAVFSLFIGGFVLSKNRTSEVHISFALFALSLFVWLFGYTVTYSIADEQTALLFARISCTGAMFTSPSFYYFTVSYLKRSEERIFVLISFVFFILLIPFMMTSTYFLSGVYKYSWGFYSKAGSLYFYYLLFFFGVFMRGFFMLYFSFKRGWSQMSPMEIARNRYIFIAYVIALIGSIDYIPKFGVDFYPFGFFFEIVFVSVIAYAILRYRAMEIQVAVKKGMAYSLAAGLLMSLFVVLVLSITNLFSNFAEVHSFQISVFAAIVIALLFNPLRHRIQKGIDKVFYKKTYDYYSTIQQVSATLASMFDLQNIYRFMGNIIYEVLGLKTVCILATISGDGYEVVYNVSKQGRGKVYLGHLPGDGNMINIDSNSEIVKFCRKSGEIIIKNTLPAFESNHGSEIVRGIVSELEAFQGEVVIPVYVDSELSALMILGEKMSGDIFADEDIHLLSTISDQAASAIKNASMYKDKVNSERLASIGMMAATFAHEIRNPLTSLKTFAQLMPEKYNDEEFRDTFSKIVVKEIDRINSLIGDLLDFSIDKESGRVNEFELNALMDEIIEYIKGRIELDKQNILIEKVYNTVKIVLYGDVEKLKQAFINIINNGCQAMNGTGILQVEIIPNSRNVDISISDTGEGIHPDDITRIFDPFVTTKEMGVGLGLAISKRVIEGHSGKILVKSKLSKGTTFTVTLPMQYA